MAKLDVRGMKDAPATEQAAATDSVLRFVARGLLHAEDKDASQGGSGVILPQEGERLRSLAGPHVDDVASGLCFLRNRIQVPRDMAAPAAATLREALMATAATLVGAPRALELLRQHEGPFACRRDVRSRC